MNTPVTDQVIDDVRRMVFEAREHGQREGYRIGRYDARQKYMRRIGMAYLLGFGCGAAFVVLAVAWWPK